MDTPEEIVADYLAVKLGMCGQGTDAHSSEIGALAVEALREAGLMIPQGWKLEWRDRWVTPSERRHEPHLVQVWA